MRKTILIPALVLQLSVNLSAQNDSIWTLEKCINYALNRNVNEVFETTLSIKSQIKNAEVNKQIAAPDENIT